MTLFLMGYKGFFVLKNILPKFISQVDQVIIGRDSSVQNDYYLDICSLCKKYEVSFHNRTDSYIVESRYAIAISWRWLISLQETKLIVLHDSLLPKYRGFNPLVTSLLNKDEKIGVTALYASEEYDRGDIIAQSASNVSYPIKIQQAIEKISENYAELVNDIFQTLLDRKEIKGLAQKESEASYSLWRDEQDYYIDWNLSSKYIKRFVDAVGYPYAGALTHISEKEQIRILDVEEVNDVSIFNRQVGKVIFLKDNIPTIVCGTGLVKILKAQDRNGSPYSFKKFRLRLY